MIKRKLPFTLLETLVAMTLCGLVLTFLFSQLKMFTLAASPEHTKAREKILKQHQAYLRLAKIFVEPHKLYTKNLDDKNAELIFTFEGGLDTDPHFCLSLLNGRLFVESETLKMERWPNNPENMKKTDTLLCEVESITFSFLNKEQKVTDNWEEQISPLPIAFICHIHTKTGKIDFPFFPFTSETGIPML